MRLIPVAVTAFAAWSMLATQAAADWEYTRWGMTPAQVVAASHGTVHAIAPQRRGGPGVVTQAEGTFSAGKIVLEVSFGFRGVNGGLDLVSYVVKDAAQNYALRDALVARHGRPEPSGDEDLGAAIWHGAGGDTIDLSLSDEGPAFVVQRPAAGR